MVILVKVFIVANRHRDHDYSYKGKHLIGAGLQFRCLVQYHYGRKQGSMQAHIVLDRELSFLHLDLKAAGRDSEP